MKIMVLAGYMSIPGLKGFEKATSGLGYTVGRIVVELAKVDEVYVLTQSTFTKERKERGVTIVSHPVRSLIGILPSSYLRRWKEATKNVSFFSVKKYRILAYYLSGYYAERAIYRIKPDIVNIRGIGWQTDPFVLACRRTNTPFVVSLHGLNSFNKEIRCEKDIARIERELLKEVKNNKLWITTISTGIKRRVSEYLKVDELKKVFVVTNGLNVDVCNQGNSSVNREMFGIADNAIVLIYCASMTENKNHIQLLRAYSLLSEETKKRINILFVGDGGEKEYLLNYCTYAGIKDRVVFVGRVDKRRVSEYYGIADINVLISYSEGFGNSFIEGFAHGLQSITFGDLDAVKDIYNEGAVVVAKERTDQSLAEAISIAVNNDWDTDYIREYSKKYDTREMINKYRNIFEMCIEESRV